MRPLEQRSRDHLLDRDHRRREHLPHLLAPLLPRLLESLPVTRGVSRRRGDVCFREVWATRRQ
jgi:hypothetical protein